MADTYQIRTNPTNPKDALASKPEMPQRHAVSIEEFEATMHDVRAHTK